MWVSQYFVVSLPNVITSHIHIVSTSMHLVSIVFLPWGEYSGTREIKTLNFCHQIHSLRLCNFQGACLHINLPNQSDIVSSSCNFTWCYIFVVIVVCSVASYVCWNGFYICRNSLYTCQNGLYVWMIMFAVSIYGTLPSSWLTVCSQSEAFIALIHLKLYL